MSNPTFTTEQLLAYALRTAIAYSLMEKNPGLGALTEANVEFRCEILSRSLAESSPSWSANPGMLAHLNRIVHIFSENTPISAGEETEETL